MRVDLYNSNVYVFLGELYFNLMVVYMIILSHKGIIGSENKYCIREVCMRWEKE